MKPYGEKLLFEGNSIRLLANNAEIQMSFSVLNMDPKYGKKTNKSWEKVFPHLRLFQNS